MGIFFRGSAEKKTQCVEVVCLLSKLKSNHHIEVELKLDGMV